MADPPPVSDVDSPPDSGAVVPVAAANPVSASDVGPPLDTGAVASDPPGIAHTPDGRTLTVSAEDETQLPVAALTAALTSRDWLVGGTFTGTTTGSVKGGTLEVGYQIGCRIAMDKVSLRGQVGIGIGNFTSSGSGLSSLGSATLPVLGQIEIDPKPGTITNVTVDKKTFKGTSPRISMQDVHIKVDNCVGASSLRSYAIFTSLDPESSDVVAYYGVGKAF
jgi:hypothetical protein